MTAQNPTRKTPQVVYPRLMSELFYQCGIIKRILDAQVPDLLEEQRANFINGHTLANMRMLKEALKVPNHPLLVKKPSGPLPEKSPMLFDNESKDVILEYMRLMKEEGITITGADIAHVPTEDKKRKRVVKVKQEKASEDKAVEATDSEIKTTSEKSKGKSTKKQRSERKKVLKVQRRMIIQEVDDEETDEEPLEIKRKRVESVKAQPEHEGMNIEANA
ncbi:hypothetical protein A2U01_0034517, partial [Trifolium medium]|nr:hypothetical protein [Trifolium medium]